MGTTATIGDDHNVSCPWCLKNNHYVTRGVDLDLHKVMVFSRTCHHCGRSIFYRAEYAIQVKASRENPLVEEVPAIGEPE